MFTRKQTAGLCCSLFFLSILFLSSCASNTATLKQVQAHTENTSKSNFLLIEAPFFPQQDYHCGPAALASVFNFHQRKLEPNEIAEQVFVPGKQGSLQLEMKAATRRAGLFPYELTGGFDSLIKELDAGNPVLVLQNLAFDWKPQWHYALVLGYDFEKKQMILHSGKKAYYRLHIATFMKTWERTDKWALVITPVDHMPASAEQENYLREAIALENTAAHPLAFQAYQQALIKWPENHLALIGAGNFYYQNGQYKQAIETFLALTRLEKEHSAAWNNLAYALHKQGCYNLSQQAIAHAVKHAKNKQPFLESQQELKQIPNTSLSNAFCESLNIQ